MHVTVLLYLCPLKDILWSETYEDEDWKDREACQINTRELGVMYHTSMSRRLDQTFSLIQDNSSKRVWMPDRDWEP